jgi:EpsI family protein
VPAQLLDHTGTDVTVSDRELMIAGVDDHILRAYSPADRANFTAFTVYVGYYARQRQGHTIHSPKNCLPGAGWEQLVSSPQTIQTSAGPVQVTRYLMQREQDRAVVLYWYQGRGRVEANEYQVKLDLFRDAALHRRSDEALVRVFVPVTAGEDAAAALATSVAANIIPSLWHSLPQ